MSINSIVGDRRVAKELSENNDRFLLDLSEVVVGSTCYSNILKDEEREGIVISIDNWNMVNNWHKLQIMYEDLSYRMIRKGKRLKDLVVVGSNSSEVVAFVWKIKTSMSYKAPYLKLRNEWDKNCNYSNQYTS